MLTGIVLTIWGIDATRSGDNPAFGHIVPPRSGIDARPLGNRCHSGSGASDSERGRCDLRPASSRLVGALMPHIIRTIPETPGSIPVRIGMMPVGVRAISVRVGTMPVGVGRTRFEVGTTRLRVRTGLRGPKPKATLDGIAPRQAFEGCCPRAKNIEAPAGDSG